MHSSKETSKTTMIKRMLMKGWRERWTEFQWGINVKKILPRGVSGDVYGLADCILSQAMGVSTNLSFLKHSLCSHLISHSAVIKRISKYDSYDRYYYLNILLNFLISVIDGITCRTKPEEMIIVNATLSLISWIIEVYSAVLEKVFSNSGNALSEQQDCMEKSLQLLEKITGNEFLMSILYVAKTSHDENDVELFDKLKKNCVKIKSLSSESSLSRFSAINAKILEHLGKILLQKIESLEIENLEIFHGVESTTYCLQPLLSIEILLNPTADTQTFITELQMIQRLKGFSNPKLYCEIIRACLICMNNVNGTSRDSVWCAFTFLKIPQILKQLNAQSKTDRPQADTSDDIVKTFEMLLENTSIIDMIDVKNNCNSIELLLTGLKKNSLINDSYIQFFSKRRESHLATLQKLEHNTAIIKYVLRAEEAFDGILKTLGQDYVKFQDSFLKMLCQVLSGNSFELILSVAIAEGKLKTFVYRLIKCNENSKQVPGEIGKPALVRMTLFDMSFLMLYFIVQTYGSDVVLEENGNSFFEKWVRECMVEKNKDKAPMQIVKNANCDSQKIDELLMYFHTPDNPNKKLSLKWHEVCANLPAVLHQTLMAWEHETLSVNDVKNILENMRSKLLCYSVCAASWLCSYMQVVKQDELLKPLNVLQQLTAASPEDIQQKEDTYKERLGLTIQIIGKMQQNFNPSGNPKIRALLHNQNLVSQKPMAELFDEHWKIICESCWLPVDSAQTFKSLLQSCGPFWFVNKLLDKVFQCKFIKDMEKTKDIIFAIMHLDIERCTIALLTELLPILLNSKEQNCKIVEPYSRVIAKLCVYAIISAIESPNLHSKKRSRNVDSEDQSIYSPSAKSRKLALDQTSVSSGLPTDFGDSSDNISSMSEPMMRCLVNMFKNFMIETNSDKLSPKSYFIFEFFTILVQCGNTEQIKPILKLIPSGLPQHLLKTIPSDLHRVGFILRLYDLGITNGRQSAVSDLCLLRNIQIRKNSIKL